MFGFESIIKVDPHKILALLEDFERFCLGERYATPEQFKEMNEELSLGTLVHVGTCRFVRKDGQKHLVWNAPDGVEHDLGPVDKIIIMKDCPGFHRTRSLALGHNQVQENSQITVPPFQKQISMVRLKDGTIGFGPNYKIALRNAVLKRNLKKDFLAANPKDSWKDPYSHA